MAVWPAPTRTARLLRRQPGAAALFGGCHGDTLPALLRVRTPESSEAHERSVRHDRHDARHARHRRVPHYPVHLVALQHSLHERRLHRRLWWRHDGIAKHNRRRVSICPDDACVVFVTVSVEDGDLVAGRQAHHAREVVGLVR